MLTLNKHKKPPRLKDSSLKYHNKGGFLFSWVEDNWQSSTDNGQQVKNQATGALILLFLLHLHVSFLNALLLLFNMGKHSSTWAPIQDVWGSIGD